MKSSQHNFECFRRGEEAALEHYMQEYIEGLSFFAFKIIKDQYIVEEIVGDTFLKLWQQRDRMESDEHIYGFLYKVTRNACINYLKKDQSQPKFESDYNKVILYDEKDVQFDIIYSEFIQILYKELEKLPVQQSKVFKMSYLEGHTTEEICTALDTTPSNVFYAKSKALQALRRTFKKQGFFMYLMFSWIFIR